MNLEIEVLKEFIEILQLFIWIQPQTKEMDFQKILEKFKWIFVNFDF
jgi:hypothetical protein